MIKIILDNKNLERLIEDFSGVNDYSGKSLDKSLDKSLGGLNIIDILLQNYDRITCRLLEYVINSCKLNIKNRDDKSYDILKDACEFLSYEIVKKMVEGGADIGLATKIVDIGLRYALEGLEKLLELFLNDVNINFSNIVPMNILCEKKNYEIAKIIIDQCENLNIKNDLIFIACNNKNARILQYIIDKGGNINTKNRIGQKPIHTCCKSSNIKILKCLLENGACINEPDINNYRLIHYACIKSNFKFIKFVISQGAYIDLPTYSGKKPLHFLCENKNKDEIEYLVSLRIDLDYLDNEGNTPLHLAIYAKKIHNVKFLIYKTNCDIFVRNDNLETTQQILEDNFGSGKFSLLFEKSFIYKKHENIKYYDSKNLLIKNNNEICEELYNLFYLKSIDNESNVNIRNLLYCIIEPLHNKNEEIFDDLIFPLVILNQKHLNNEIIKYVIDHVRILKRFYGFEDMKKYASEIIGEKLKSKFPCERVIEGYDNLFELCNNSSEEVIKYFILKFKKLITGEYAEFIFHILCSKRKNMKNLIKLLIDDGYISNINEIRDIYLRNPIHYACINYDLELVKYFEEKGVDLKYKDINGFSPIHIACSHYQYNIVEYLINKGNNINSLTFLGFSPIFFACDNYDPKIVSLLVKKGANLNTTSNDGMTPLKCLLYKGKLITAKYLLDNGAKIATYEKMSKYLNSFFKSEYEEARIFNIN